MIPCGIEDPNGLCPLECFLHSLCSAKGRGEPPQGRTPHFLFETSKRKCAAPGGKENMFGGSACAGAALLPPAGEGWQSLAAVRDGNAPPLGKPPARGGTGIPPCPSPRCRSRSREEAGSAWRSGRRSGMFSRSWIRHPPANRRSAAGRKRPSVRISFQRILCVYHHGAFFRPYRKKYCC